MALMIFLIAFASACFGLESIDSYYPVHSVSMCFISINIFIYV